MAHGNVTIPIPGELQSAAVEGIVASTEAIYDYNLNKTQEDINQQINDYIQSADIIRQMEENLVQNVTYSELRSLKLNSQLVPGIRYRITDYKTYYKLQNLESNNSSDSVDSTTDSTDSYIFDSSDSSDDIDYREGNTFLFDIIVTALTNNTLDENAKIVSNNRDLSKWSIKYSLDNLSEYKWSVFYGKGVIYYMKDEYGNECPYDFMNIQFNYNGYLVYTFSNSDYSLSTNVRNNIIKPCYENYLNRYYYVLNKNIFISDSCIENNYCDYNSHDNIVTELASNCFIGKQSFKNYLTSAENCQLGDNCINIDSNYSKNLYIGNNCNNLVIFRIGKDYLSIPDYFYSSVITQEKPVERYLYQELEEEESSINLADTVNFIDKEIKKICLQYWDTNKDNKLTYGELAEIKQLNRAFYQKTKIEYFPEFKYFTGLNTIDDSAFKASSIESITIPNSVTKIGQGAFSMCRQLSLINLPQNLAKIDMSAFNSCSNLRSITIPQNVVTLERQVFYNCNLLKSVTLNEGLKRIKANAFKGCTSLKSITIPESVTNIEQSAFANVEIVHMLSTTPPTITSNSFESATDIYVPVGCGSIYREKWPSNYIPVIIDPAESESTSSSGDEEELTPRINGVILKTTERNGQRVILNESTDDIEFFIDNADKNFYRWLDQIVVMGENFTQQNLTFSLYASRQGDDEKLLISDFTIKNDSQLILSGLNDTFRLIYSTEDVFSFNVMDNNNNIYYIITFNFSEYSSSNDESSD